MTKDEIFCCICEEPIATKPVYDEDKDAYVDDDGIPYDCIGDALNDMEKLALWNEEWESYVCMGCVTSAYEIAHGAPILKRIRQAIGDWRWRWYKWKHRNE